MGVSLPEGTKNITLTPSVLMGLVSYVISCYFKYVVLEIRFVKLNCDYLLDHKRQFRVAGLFGIVKVTLLKPSLGD